MSKLDSEGNEVIEREVETSLIQFLLHHLKCEEQDESVIIKKTDLIQMGIKQHMNAKENQNEFNDLVDMLFNQQHEDSQFNVYQRLAAMIASQMQASEGEGSEEGKEEHLDQSRGADKQIREQSNKPQRDNSNPLTKEEANAVAVESDTKSPQRLAKPFLSLDYLSQDYTDNKKNSFNNSNSKMLDEAQILNQDMINFNSINQDSNDLLTEQLLSKQFETVIQPSNDFQSPFLNLDSIPLSINPKQVELFKNSLNPSNKDKEDKEDKENNDNADPSNNEVKSNPQAKKFSQPPSYNPLSQSQAQTQKSKRAIFKLSNDLSNEDKDYFLQLFQSAKSKQVQLLSDKINKVSSKSYIRNKNKEFSLVNAQHKPTLPSNSIITPLRTRNLKKRPNALNDDHTNDLPKSYLKKTITHNFNEILKSRHYKGIEHSFKTRNYNLKNPQEKQLYIQTLKKDLKEFSYQKEQIKKRRDDAFGEIDDRLEGLMKKNRLGVYSQQKEDEEEHRNGEDEVNQGFIDQEKDDGKNNAIVTTDANANADEDADAGNKEDKEVIEE